MIKLFSLTGGISNDFISFFVKKHKISSNKLLLEYKKLKKKVNLRDIYAFNYMYYYNKNNALDLKNIKLEECLRKMRIATSNEINIFYD